MATASQVVAGVHLYDFLDPDPRARFWVSAEVRKAGNTWIARLPIMSAQQPLFAFANMSCHTPKSISEPSGRATERFALSSQLHTATPQDLRNAKVRATDRPSALIEDFQKGWQDWYMLSPDNPHYWDYSTRKLNDPKGQGQPGQLLAIDVQTDKPNGWVIVLTENFFRSCRGKQKEFITVVKLKGGKDWQSVSLSPGEFKTVESESLASWKQLDLLSFRAYHDRDEKLLGNKSWAGKQPVSRNLCCQSE